LFLQKINFNTLNPILKGLFENVIQFYGGKDMKKIIVLIIALMISMFAGCGDEENNDTDPYDVYALGWEIADSSSDEIYYYWKNGEKTPLQDADSVNALSVSGDKIYVAGEVSQTEACYWENGVKNVLEDDGGAYPQATDIFISGNDLFISGNFDLRRGTSSDVYYTACYWENGNLVKITEDISADCEANSIYADSDYIYVAGRERINTVSNTYQVCYWKINRSNGDVERVNLTDAVINTEATGILVSGSDVYVSGRTNGTACYWKNSEDAVEFADFYRSNAISVIGSDIYVAVSGGDEGVLFYKNGDKVNLTDASQYGAVNSMFVLDNMVYAAGYITNASNPDGVIWKDGQSTGLIDHSSVLESEIIDIFVTKN